MAADTLVTHNPRFSFNNLSRADLPELPVIKSWSLPFPGASRGPAAADGDGPDYAAALMSGAGIADCAHATEPPYLLWLRPAANSELEPALHHPPGWNSTLHGDGGGGGILGASADRDRGSGRRLSRRALLAAATRRSARSGGGSKGKGGKRGKEGPPPQHYFSRCTLPVLLMTDWPYALVSWWAAGVAAMVDDMVQRGALDDSATLVAVTPGGLGLTASQRLLLQRYSRRPVITAAELGRLGPPGPVEWSGEGTRVHCFSKVVICKSWAGDPDTPTAPAGQRMGAALAAAAVQAGDPDPAGFGPPRRPQAAIAVSGASGGTGDRDGDKAEAKAKAALAARVEAEAVKAGGATLRVLFEVRSGPIRRILNLAQVLAACEDANRKGFSAGPFRRIACAAHDFDPAGNGTLVSPARLAANIAAVRAAHVLVAPYGEGSAYGMFMHGYRAVRVVPPANGTANGTAVPPQQQQQQQLEDEEGGEELLQPGGGVGRRGVGSVVLELRACGFGTNHTKHADRWSPLMYERSAAAGAPVFVAYAVEDPAQCEPSDLQRVAEGLVAARAAAVAKLAAEKAAKAAAKAAAAKGIGKAAAAYGMAGALWDAQWNETEDGTGQPQAGGGEGPGSAQGEADAGTGQPAKEESQEKGSGWFGWGRRQRRLQDEDTGGEVSEVGTLDVVAAAVAAVPGVEGPQVAAAAAAAPSTRRRLAPKPKSAKAGPELYVRSSHSARDQHLQLNVKQLMEVLEKVGSWVADRSARDEAVAAAAAAGQTGPGKGAKVHAYVFPQGRTVWAPLGVKKAAQELL
ncbi:hypothetical protein HXX76_007388 [Chlamydomonas incerta]|uniref:Uncharacterized protein n=1 Tax=Chlamydomonas incerta TaxID=51695 RepID=A0A835W2X9_CHLIN|nr:hypothetical protein HXX76_007388 [Chlamydomonas incerta]|eukprot:KAG2435313.1 hypothetical protein HXX76_007388 [Chlamydomonas incerta]